MWCSGFSAFPLITGKNMRPVGQSRARKYGKSKSVSGSRIDLNTMLPLASQDIWNIHQLKRSGRFNHTRWRFPALRDMRMKNSIFPRPFARTLQRKRHPFACFQSENTLGQLPCRIALGCSLLQGVPVIVQFFAPAKSNFNFYAPVFEI